MSYNVNFIKKKEVAMQCQTQRRNFRTNQKFKVNFCLPKSGAETIVIYECHVDESTGVRYAMILGRDLLISMGLYIFSYS